MAALARCVAGFWSAVETEVLSSTADRWRGISADLDMIASREATPVTDTRVRLIIDGEHETLLHDWISTAQSRILFASHKLGPVSNILSVIRNIKRLGSLDLSVVYGQMDDDEIWSESDANNVREKKGRLRHLRDFRGKVLLSDTSACVTSYDFLAAHPFGAPKTSREVGIVIEGQQLADWLWRQLSPE